MFPAIIILPPPMTARPPTIPIINMSDATGETSGMSQSLLLTIFCIPSGYIYWIHRVWDGFHWLNSKWTQIGFQWFHTPYQPRTPDFCVHIWTHASNASKVRPRLYNAGFSRVYGRTFEKFGRISKNFGRTLNNFGHTLDALKSSASKLLRFFCSTLNIVSSQSRKD
ncbi:hypothetical protein K435DRAFT_800980 [Dendrothele bispora CBS 962.96]|uniref:Uncharacterized protein n=1 Tax=Dendrothele bispora (strain CBS 962.96) TaxID=1314807 RepID=A0A4V4HEN5_DENBC|nr:hypothetical protein K435DRAFT_800980 [Dendrothele bispora CBS 962.96]